MLSVKRLLYTRSLTNDYRWIYCDIQLDQDDKNNILSDYEKYRMERHSYLNENHLIVRLTKSGIAFYKFVETERIDQNARKISSLTGFVFSDFESEIVKSLLNFVVAYFYIKKELFEAAEKEIKDSMGNIELSTVFSLDEILNECKKNVDIDTVRQRIFNYMNQNSLHSFVIKDNSISPILLMEKQPTLMEQSLIKTNVDVEHNSNLSASQNNKNEWYDEKNKFKELCGVFKIRNKKHKW